MLEDIMVEKNVLNKYLNKKKSDLFFFKKNMHMLHFWAREGGLKSKLSVHFFIPKKKTSFIHINRSKLATTLVNTRFCLSSWSLLARMSKKRPTKFSPSVRSMWCLHLPYTVLSSNDFHLLLILEICTAN